MGKWKERHGQYEIRFYDNSRKPKEKSESMPLDTPKHVLDELEYEMNRAFRRGWWDPWRMGWKEYKLTDGKGVSSDRMVKDLVLYHCDKCIKNQYWTAENTIKNNKRVLLRFADFVGPHQDVSILREHHIRNFLKECSSYGGAGEISKNTRNSYLRILKGFYNRLAREGIHETNLEIKRSMVRDERIKYYTEDQMKQVVKAFNDSVKGTHGSIWPYYDKLYIFLFYMGLRIGEALGLQKQDYDLRTNMLTVDGKWNKVRVIELLPPAKDAFYTFYNRASNPEDKLIDITAKAARENLDKLNKMVFDPDHPAYNLTPHSLRHGCGTYWLSQGVSIKVLSDFMGHEDESTTYKYAKLVPGYISSEFRQAWHNSNSDETSADDFGVTGAS